MEYYFCKVYHEDTDAGGIVYYANYLKYIERARTESLGTIGLFQNKIKDQLNLIFVVKSIFAEYLKPARLDDILEVTTNFIKLGVVSIVVEQEIFLNKTKIFGATVKLGIIDLNGKPKKMPSALRLKLENLLKKSIKI
tara:strand:+ start:185 stop:598 length:414 start_codon:yes stop_codon:yes gene_type:complete